MSPQGTCWSNAFGPATQSEPPGGRNGSTQQLTALAGFQGRAIRGIAQSGADGTLILVAVDDAAGLYRAM